MTWLLDGLTFLKQSFRPLIETVGEKKFSNETFTEIKPKLDPLSGPFKVNTLAALRDLIAANVEAISTRGDSSPVLHIVDHQNVRLVVGVSDTEGRRLVFAEASPMPYQGFAFNTYRPIDEFIVGIQAHFAANPDRDYLLSTASKVTVGAVATSEDDGISQQVTAKANIALKDSISLRSRVSLRPFRTFSEVDQPESEFILRAKSQDGALPQLALFEADGGKWKVAAVQNISFTLRDLGIKLPIIA